VTELLYLDRAYAAEFDARVVRVEGDSVELDRTLFYPEGGGQPCDTGTLASRDGARWTVGAVSKEAGVARHRLEGGSAPPIGSSVHGRVDWPRRHLHMRYHTAVHLLSGAAYARFGSEITGSQIASTGARLDLVLPEARRSTCEELVATANAEIERNRPVEVRWVDAAELERSPSLVRVRRDLVPAGERLRLIDIVGFDVQADGGTHVRSTGEVGPIRFDRFENKGARNKRLYVRLEERPPPPPDAA
jgi:misacylated tRNA(Ala) deacylase